MRWFRFAYAAALMALCAGTASAQQQWSLTRPGTCYARSYDAAHLRTHPQQTVQRFYLGTPSAEWRALNTATLIHVAFGFEMTNGPTVYSGTGMCHPHGVGLACDAEGDGGSFTVEPNGAGVIVRVARLEVEGPQDFSPDLATMDNRVMNLYQTNASGCAG